MFVKYVSLWVLFVGIILGGCGGDDELTPPYPPEKISIVSVYPEEKS